MKKKRTARVIIPESSQVTAAGIDSTQMLMTRCHRWLVESTWQVHGSACWKWHVPHYSLARASMDLQARMAAACISSKAGVKRAGSEALRPRKSAGTQKHCACCCQVSILGTLQSCLLILLTWSSGDGCTCSLSDREHLAQALAFALDDCITEATSAASISPRRSLHLFDFIAVMHRHRCQHAVHGAAPRLRWR